MMMTVPLYLKTLRVKTHVQGIPSEIVHAEREDRHRGEQSDLVPHIVLFSPYWFLNHCLDEKRSSPFSGLGKWCCSLITMQDLQRNSLLLFLGDCYSLMIIHVHGVPSQTLADHFP